MTTQAEAPSESWLALPAVITPFSPATGLSAGQPLGGRVGAVALVLG